MNKARKDALKDDTMRNQLVGGWEDPLIPAYALIVDGECAGVLHMHKHGGYGFSYWPLIPRMLERFLPEGWRSFSVFDIPRQAWLCGSVRSMA